MEKFKIFVLNSNDIDEPVTRFHEYCHTPVFPAYEFIGKPEISTKEDKICYSQEIFLKNETEIFVKYMILSTSEDAMKTANFISSDTAWVAHVLFIKSKEKIGLEKYATAYYYNESHDYVLVFQCKNIVVSVGIRKETGNKEELVRICNNYAKIIVERIKMNPLSTDTVSKYNATPNTLGDIATQLLMSRLPYEGNN
jgi:hypothetical protein